MPVRPSLVVWGVADKTKVAGEEEPGGVNTADENNTDHAEKEKE